MKYILILVFFINLQLISSEYKLSWFPKDKYFDSIKTPENNKFSLINTAGVWEDNRGSFGVMKCLISLFTKENKSTDLDGFCEADDINVNSKFWVTLTRNSLETSGVGKMTYVSGTGIYKNVIGITCAYAVTYLGEYGIIKQKCNKDFISRLNKE